MKIYGNIIFFLIILILILSAFNSYIFTWQELIRIFFIFLGIILLYLKYSKKFLNIKYEQLDSEIIKLISNFNKEQKGLAVFSAILFIFILSQFDPAISNINRIITVEKFNWYFIATFVITFVSLILFFIIISKFKKVESFKSLRPKVNIDSGDRFTLFLFIVLSLLGFFSRLLLSKNADWENYYYIELKLVQYIAVWFVIKHLIFLEVKFNIKKDENIIGYSLIPFRKIKRIYVGLSSLIFLTLLIGCFRFSDIYESFKKANDLNINSNVFGKEITLNYETLDKNKVFGLSYFNNVCLENLALIYIKIDSTKKLNEIIENIKNINKGNEKIEEWLGNIYYKVDKLNLAQKEYESFLQKGFENKDVIKNLGQCYITSRNISGIIKLINDYNYLPSIQYDNKDDYILVGNSLIETKYFYKAKESFEMALELDTDDSYIYYKLGGIYFKTNDYDLAIQNFKKAIELDTTFADAYYRLGLCYESKGNKKEALKYFDKTVEILPNHLDGLMKLKKYYDNGISTIDTIPSSSY